MAQCTQPFSVGGAILENSTTNSLGSTQINTKSSKSSDNQQLNGCSDEPPMEEVVVFGHATHFSWGFIRFWWSPSPGGNSGGSGSTITFTQVDANKACNALGAAKRLDLLNEAFGAARSLATNSGQLQSFLRDYPPGSIFTLTLPNGSKIRGIVSGNMMGQPILTEASNSCE